MSSTRISSSETCCRCRVFSNSSAERSGSNMMQSLADCLRALR